MSCNLAVLTVRFFESGQVAIHAVFASHLCALWEVVDHLISTKGLVDDAFDVGAGPLDSPLLVALGHLPEAVVFKGVAHQWNVDAVVKLEKVAFISGLVGPNRHGVDVGTENHELLLDDVVDGFVLLDCLLKG